MCDDAKISEILVRVSALETDQRELRSQNKMILCALREIIDILSFGNRRLEVAQ